MLVTPPHAATIFLYNVGFGDCMLLRFCYPDGGARHVLIDFGTTKWAAKFRPESMEAVAEQIKEHCGGKLEMVVASHRHRDHISGFAGASGEVIASLKPAVVVQPWTEKPGLAVDAKGVGVAAPISGHTGLAARQFATRLDSLQAVAEQVCQQIPRIRSTKGVTKTVADQLNFIGETNIKNLPAVQALQRLGKRRVYASFGTDLKLARLLPGVDVEVLGPPTLAQSRDIARMANVNADEFWHLLAASRDQIATDAAPALFPNARRARTIPQEAKWLIPRIDRMQAEELLAIVRILDGVMNNTSLILLFSVGDSRLLFPGDAQLENWRYALQNAPNADAIRRKLADTKVYKVGHHGSLNATPRTMLWDRFLRAGATDEAERLITLLSTTTSNHGHEDHATEVPRRRLVDELEARSRLFNTQNCNKDTGWWREATVML